MNNCVWDIINICINDDCKCVDFESKDTAAGKSIIKSYKNAVKPIKDRFRRIQVLLSES